MAGGKDKADRIERGCQTISQILNLPTPQAVQRLEMWRWPDGIACPWCGSSQNYIITSRFRGNGIVLFRCQECRSDFTATTGSILSGLKTSVQIALAAIAMARSHEVSVLRFAKEVGITQRAAWYLFARIRSDARIAVELNGD